MKGISLWQPWAQLVVLGEKQYETRSWPTSVRGRVLIHAAKKWNKDIYEFCQVQRFFCDVIGKCYLPIEPDNELGISSIPLGMIVGSVEIVDCLLVEKVPTLTDKERAFGDYTPGRYAWKLSDPVVFKRPIPCRGHQGFWDEALPEGL